jgi:hypothetical protein
MEVDLYQRRGGFAGLGVVDPVTGLDSSVAAPASTDILSSLTGGIDLTSMSPTTLLVAGAFGLWMLSSIFSGGKKVYSKVARPIKKRRKRKAALADAEERYERERRRIEKGESRSRGGGGFF